MLNTNVINERGLAADPETGKPIPVREWTWPLQCLVRENGERNLYTKFLSNPSHVQ